jgi:hypothetical protein
MSSIRADLVRIDVNLDSEERTVLDMTPPAAQAYVEVARLTHAVPAEERTKQAALDVRRAEEETKRAEQETKRAQEETKQNEELTKRTAITALHETIRHALVFVAALVAIIVIAIIAPEGEKAKWIAATVAVLGGVYGVVQTAKTIVDRPKKRLPPGPTSGAL